MTIINLRNYYPFYTTDCFIEVPDEVAEAMAESFQELQDMLTDRWSNNACRGYVIKTMENAASSQRILARCLWNCTKSLTSAPWKKRRHIIRTDSPDLGPSWTEAWRKTKGRHSLPCVVFSRFPTGGGKWPEVTDQLEKEAQWQNLLPVRRKPEPYLFRER